ncbi:putative mitochondrial kinetoplast poly(A) polymerase 1 [Leptomonas pyrrhocoris]|uniref:RNA uridylyltransferase n=1 Tax=Leptomonas pyrrhocoris TaxID=157538 RepID=A0A0M9G9D1_LEPPY|nr:putative mitochondrial kinetoplast poly(A) polymerase 1 [Leptomonas pyrrhocoris]KPA85463.1 putative mitochondrial kinetoplast poly(A) polymerase 1 [Leptomonas pyrrhocoris]|eukprot:XP_015663902.1 putative mitochondrial kinetoplast poly(A) polymerase 1 [Leptomonas pyrrhocoris]
MRRFLTTAAVAVSARAISIPWESQLPNINDPLWHLMGQAVTELALTYDTGKVAFDECCSAREQLESIVQSMGYDMSIYIFGGLVTSALFEVGGDVDFVGILDIEPGFEEAGEIVRRATRELRRLGIRARAYPKARVPVIKADRVSRSLPGSPLHNLSCDGIFQFSRQLRASEAETFDKRVTGNYNALSVEWNSSYQFATVQFATTSSLMYALANLKAHNEVEIPLRLPVDALHGPELYRFPFDFCLSSTGLRNSHLLGEALQQHPYSRHLLLILKKWGRASGIINSIDGLLASYALTVMLVHFLSVVQAIPKISVERIAVGPSDLSPNPKYRPLAAAAPESMPEVGYLFAAFFEYYGTIFNYAENVVCTTNTKLTKSTMHWDQPNTAVGKPPFFHFAIKDPYGLDNIARNLDLQSVKFVQETHQMAFESVLGGTRNPAFVVTTLIKEPPMPSREARSLSDRGIYSQTVSSDQLEARHVLNKLRFHQRKRSMEALGEQAVKNFNDQNKASDVTRNVLGWIRKDSDL